MFRISGFVFRISGFGFWDSGFGFGVRILGFESRSLGVKFVETGGGVSPGEGLGLSVQGSVTRVEG